MDKFNDIGIDDKLDWNRIEKLMRIGIFAIIGYQNVLVSISGIHRYSA